MKTNFRIGTHRFHKEPNMNYTLNRIYAINGGDLNEVRAAAGKIQTIEDWIREFMDLAHKALSENRKLQAAAYFRAANFYLAGDDQRKRDTYETCTSLMHEMYKDEFISGIIKEKRVPFAGGYLPVWHVEPANKDAEKNVVVMHLGYDSIKEELIPVIQFFREADMELYIFEGPGQGEALYRYNLKMMHEWEKPVKAVLNHFDLTDVTLVGLSLGGYLAPRAAIYESRVNRVIAWGVLYDFFDTVMSRRGMLLEYMLKALLVLHASSLVNAVTRRKMERDTYARWGVEHGMNVYGVKTPYEYFQKLRMYSMKKISHLVKQDFLILASTEDHFIPKKHVYRQIEKLTNVRSLTARIFTKYEDAENHVSFGNVPLVMECMINWIRAHTTGSTRVENLTGKRSEKSRSAA